MVDGVVRRLDAAGQLDNTYIFYTTDNGYHISQHRMHPGKECGFDTDINIPLVVRGPGVERGAKSLAVTAHTDLAPTFLHLAGATPRSTFDGGVMPLRQGERAKSEHVNIEFWGNAAGEGKFGFRGDWGNINGSVNGYRNNTYKGLRLISATVNLYYAVWCTNEKELYDSNQDPGQVRNLLDEKQTMHADRFSIQGRGLAPVVNRLNALMMVLKSCQGDSCREPWSLLHPDDPNVDSLASALDARFDEFYEVQPRVRFDNCELGYIRESEGPQNVHQHGSGTGGVWTGEADQVPMVRPDWSEWV